MWQAGTKRWRRAGDSKKDQKKRKNELDRRRRKEGKRIELLFGKCIMCELCYYLFLILFRTFLSRRFTVEREMNNIADDEAKKKKKKEGGGGDERFEKRR